MVSNFVKIFTKIVSYQHSAFKAFDENYCNISAWRQKMGNFGERLKEMRKEEGLSQWKLAQKVGLTHTAIGHWERNERVPNLQAVIILARYFKVTLDYIAGIEY